MAGSASNYLEDKINDHLLGGTTYSPLATVYLALWTATLSDSSTGAPAGEVSGGSYARLAITNNTTNWPNSSGGVKSNGTVLTFATPSGSWGTVTDWALIDSSSGAGNILFYGTLTTPKTINSGDTVSFAVSALTVTTT